MVAHHRFFYRERYQRKFIELQNEDGELEGLTEAGIKRAKEEKAPLSQIINVLNDRFGTESTEADRLFFDQMEAEL